MPVIKSAAKQMRASKTKKARNDATKKRFRELTKEFLSLVEKGEKAAAAHLFPLVQKALDTAAKKKVVEPGTINRQKARLAKLVAGLPMAKVKHSIVAHLKDGAKLISQNSEKLVKTAKKTATEATAPKASAQKAPAKTAKKPATKSTSKKS